MQHHAIGTRSRVFLIVTQEIALLLNFWFFLRSFFFQKEVGVLEISLALSFVLSQAQDQGARPLTSRKAPCGNEFAFPEKVDRKNEMRTLNISSILLSAPKRSAERTDPRPHFSRAARVSTEGIASLRGRPTRTSASPTSSVISAPLSYFFAGRLCNLLGDTNVDVTRRHFRIIVFGVLVPTFFFLQGCFGTTEAWGMHA